MIWLVCAAVVMLSGYFVLTPLFRKLGNVNAGLIAETELDRLQDRKTAIDKAIGDLGFEYKMGRLSDGDFKQLESGYRNESAAILQKIEQMENEKRSRKRAGRSSANCPACGAETVPGKKFCADCGYKF